MLLPPKEILENDVHYHFKCEADYSIMYQLEKVTFLSEKVGKLLDLEEKSNKFYFSGNDLEYAIESLINNYSVLIEYYYAWVIFSHIGTIKHSKLNYRPIRCIDTEIEERIKKLFKAHSIGVLEKSDIDGFDVRCKEAFLEAFSFLFVGKFHEVYVLNNFLKHNRILSSYSPKASYNGSLVSVPFLYISKPTDCLLNESVFKCFFDYGIDSNVKITKSVDDYFVKIFNNNAKYIGKIGGLGIYNVNGIEYVNMSDSAGVSLESILEVSQELCTRIIDKVVDSDRGRITVNNNLNHLKTRLLAREAKTIASHLNC